MERGLFCWACRQANSHRCCVRDPDLLCSPVSVGSAVTPQWLLGLQGHLFPGGTSVHCGILKSVSYRGPLALNFKVKTFTCLRNGKKVEETGPPGLRDDCGAADGRVGGILWARAPGLAASAFLSRSADGWASSGHVDVRFCILIQGSFRFPEQQTVSRTAHPAPAPPAPCTVLRAR